MDIKWLTSTPGSPDTRDFIIGKLLEETNTTSRVITTSEYQWALDELEARKNYTLKDLMKIINTYKQQMKLYHAKRTEAKMLEDGMLCGIRSAIMERYR